MKPKLHPLFSHTLSISSAYLTYGILLTVCAAIPIILLSPSDAVQALKSNYGFATIGVISLSVAACERPPLLACFSKDAFKMPHPAALTTLLHITFSVTGVMLIIIAYELLTHPSNDHIDANTSYTVVGTIVIIGCCMISRFVSKKISTTSNA